MTENELGPVAETAQKIVTDLTNLIDPNRFTIIMPQGMKVGIELDALLNAALAPLENIAPVVIVET